MSDVHHTPPVVASCIQTRASLVWAPVHRKISGNNRYPHSVRYAVVAHTLVLESDYPWVSHHHWVLNVGGKTHYPARYARIAGKLVGIRLHQEVYVRHCGPLPPGCTIDHADRVGFHNFPSNLRPATRGQQNMNKSRQSNATSRYRGVSWFRETRKFLAVIGLDGRQVYLGLYPTDVEAALAYNLASCRLHGEFGARNDIAPDALPLERAGEIEARVEAILTMKG